MSKYQFYHSCVNWPGDVDELRACIDAAKEITRETFKRKVDRKQREELEASLGYVKHKSRGLTIADDWHVKYFRSKLEGEWVYYLRYSAIEYIFTRRQKGTNRTIQADADQRRVHYA